MHQARIVIQHDVITCVLDFYQPNIGITNQHLPQFGGKDDFIVDSYPPVLSHVAGKCPFSVYGDSASSDLGDIMNISWICQISFGDGSKPWYLVNPKIAGKWIFIPLKMVLIGTRIDPYPFVFVDSTMLIILLHQWFRGRGCANSRPGTAGKSHGT